MFKKSSKIIWLFILWTSFNTNLYSEIVLISPKPMSTVHAEGLVIDIIFDQPVDPATIVPGKSFLVLGSLGGVLKGDLSFVNSNHGIHFKVTSPLAGGEVVTVNLASSITAANSSLHFWEFRTKTAKVDNFKLENIKTINVFQSSGEAGSLRTYGSFAGDLNQDGWHDITVVNEDVDDIRVFMSDQQGGLQEPPEIVKVTEGNNSGTPSTNEGGDFNLDGFLDLAVGQISGSAISVLLGDGTGKLSLDGVYSVGGDAPTSRSTRGLCVLDLNMDNYYDIVAASRVGNNISILINKGDGTFEASVEMEGGVQNETACTSGDFNEDGLEDVAIGGYGSTANSGADGGGIAILLSDGKGSLTLVESSVKFTDTPWMITTGDFNKDGHLDIVTDNNRTSEFSYLMGDGKGNLSEPESYPVAGTGAGGLGPLAIDVGDLDGDGFLDVLTSNYSAGNYTLYMGMEGGKFELNAHFNSQVAGSDALLHDRDRDGDLDITTIDEEADIITFFENQGDIVNVQPTESKKESIFKSIFFDGKNNLLVYELNVKKPVKFKLFTTNGTLYYSANLLPKGPHVLNLTAERIPPGIILTQVTDDKNHNNEKLVLFK